MCTMLWAMMNFITGLGIAVRRAAFHALVVSATRSVFRIAFIPFSFLCPSSPINPVYHAKLAQYMSQLSPNVCGDKVGQS